MCKFNLYFFYFFLSSCRSWKKKEEQLKVDYEFRQTVSLHTFLICRKMDFYFTICCHFITDYVNYFSSLCVRNDVMSYCHSPFHEVEIVFVFFSQLFVILNLWHFHIYLSSYFYSTVQLFNNISMAFLHMFLSHFYRIFTDDFIIFLLHFFTAVLIILL